MVTGGMSEMRIGLGIFSAVVLILTEDQEKGKKETGGITTVVKWVLLYTMATI
jgi:hypothetical protein